MRQGFCLFWDKRLGFYQLGFCPLGFCPVGFCPVTHGSRQQEAEGDFLITFITSSWPKRICR